MITMFVTRLWCVKVYPFVGKWSKRRQTETSITKTSASRNVDTPKRRQTITSTDYSVDKTKHRHTETSKDQNVDRPKCRQTETWTVQFSTLYSRVFVFIILGMYCTYICTYLWLVGCTSYISTHNFIWLLGVTLHISTSKIKSILGGIPGIIWKVKDHLVDWQ